MLLTSKDAIKTKASGVERVVLKEMKASGPCWPGGFRRRAVQEC